MTSLDDEYSLVMPFDNQSPSFAFGFECGRLYQTMLDGKKIEFEAVHSENIKQIEILCKRFRYHFSGEEVSTGWWSINAEPTGERN